VTDPQSGPPLQEMRLRPSRPPVTRLSRKVLLGLGITSVLGIGGALILALQPETQRKGAELYNTTAPAAPDGLAGLPRDYAGLPRPAPQLGPPLPGDLGRPIAAAGGTAPGMPSPAASPNPEAQRLAQEQEAARISHLFAVTSAAPTPVPSAPPVPVPAATAEPMLQDRKLAFLNGTPDRATLSPDRLEAPASPYVLQAGSVIPAALVTGLRSDLPGPVVAQVTEEVRDGPTGRFVLIPQGARLIGEYDAQIAFGQSRVLLAWTRLIMPDGHSIVLARQPASDPAGYAGLEDEVDNHLGQLLEAGLLSTVLSVGSEAGSGGNGNSIAQAIRQGASQSFNQTGQQIVSRSLNIQPTITIRPGFPVRVMVTRDLVLEPYRG
jgi:type IV secretion system protein TrbI